MLWSLLYKPNNRRVKALVSRRWPVVRRCCSMRAELLLNAGRTAAEFEQIVARKRHESGRERRQGYRCYLSWSPSFIELASEYLEAVKNQIANDRRPSFLPQN